MRGRIYSWTRTHHAFAGNESLGLPFVTVVVELPEAGGLRLTGVLEGKTDDVAIGLPVAGSPGETAFSGMTIPTIRWRLTGDAVAGVGVRQYRRGQAPLPERGVLVQAIAEACEDAGFDPADIDGFASYGDEI
eukprot:gene18780-18651_t